MPTIENSVNLGPPGDRQIGRMNDTGGGTDGHIVKLLRTRELASLREKRESRGVGADLPETATTASRDQKDRYLPLRALYRADSRLCARSRLGWGRGYDGGR